MAPAVWGRYPIPFTLSHSRISYGEHTECTFSFSFLPLQIPEDFQFQKCYKKESYPVFKRFHVSLSLDACAGFS